MGLRHALVAALIASLWLPAAAPAAGSAAFFRVPCAFSHRAPDDPIVAPGRPGAAHLHDFFGNRGTGAGSTYASLRAGATSCRRDGDRAAYWTPALFTAAGDPVEPRGAEIYYRGDRHADPRAVRAFPPGLRVIAGRARATAPQPTSIVGWHCGPDGTLRTRSAPPRCAAGRELRLQVRFPDCWDGERLDSVDHASHMAYGRAGRCPGSHPVAVPQLVLNVRYRLRDGRGARLSSGAPHSAHADFVNAWDPRELRRLVRVCIRAGRGDERTCRPGVPSPLPLTAHARTVAHGARVTLRGSAAGTGGPVRIQYHRAGAWEHLALVEPAADGSFSYGFRAGASRSYRAVARGRPSETVRVRVRPRVGVRLARRGRELVVHAATTPMKRRLVIRAERLRRGRPAAAARREVAARRGRASVAFRLPPGRYAIRVLTRGDRRHAAGRSRTMTVAVRR